MSSWISPKLLTVFPIKTAFFSVISSDTNNIHQWIKAWLTQQSQCVVLDLNQLFNGQTLAIKIQCV